MQALFVDDHKGYFCLATIKCKHRPLCDVCQGNCKRPKAKDMVKGFLLPQKFELILGMEEEEGRG